MLDASSNPTHVYELCPPLRGLHMSTPHSINVTSTTAATSVDALGARHAHFLIIEPRDELLVIFTFTKISGVHLVLEVNTVDYLNG